VTSQKLETEFIARFETLLDVARGAIEKSLYRGKLPARDIEFYELVSESSYRIRKEQVVDIEQIAAPLTMFLDDTPEWLGLLKLLQASKPFANYVDKMYGGPGSKMRLMPQQLLQHLLKYYLENKESAERDRRLVRRMYRILYRHFSRGTIRTEYRQYVLGLKSPFKNTKLSPITLWRIDKNQAQELINNDGYFRHLAMDTLHGQLSNIKAVLTLDIEDPVTFDSELNHKLYGARVDSFRDAVNCLRLSCNTRLIPCQLSVLTRFLPFYADSVGHGTIPAGHLPAPSKLSAKDIRVAHSCMAKLPNARRVFPRLDLALERLNSHDLRNRPIDAVIDICVAFETLVGSCLRKGKKKDRIPQQHIYLYVAHFLGKSATDRKRVFNRVGELFDERNSIIHRGEHNFGDYQLLQDASALLREALAKLITRHNTLQKKDLSQLLFGPRP